MEEKRNNQASAAEVNDLSGQPGGVALPKIVLASASPRRAEILRTVGWPFEALPAGIDETRLNGEAAATYVQRLAQTETEAAAPKRSGHLAGGADAAGVIGDYLL